MADQEDGRLSYVNEFVEAFKDPAVTNAQIIERYTVPAQYFKKQHPRWQPNNNPSKS